MQEIVIGVLEPNQNLYDTQQYKMIVAVWPFEIRSGDGYGDGDTDFNRKLLQHVMTLHYQCAA